MFRYHAVTKWWKNITLKIMGLNESNAKEVMEFIDFKLNLQNKK